MINPKIKEILDKWDKSFYAEIESLQRTIDLRGIRIEELEKEASWSNHKDLCDAYDSLKAELQRLRESASVEKIDKVIGDIDILVGYSAGDRILTKLAKAISESIKGK